MTPTRRLKGQKAKLGLVHPNTLLSMDGLAAAYQDAGRMTEAIALLKEALDLEQANLGPDHHGTLNSMGALTDAYREAGRLADALPLCEETLKRSRAKLPGG